VIVIETRLDDEEEVFSLDNLSILLLKYEETINKKMLISSPKDQNVALGLTMTTHFKKNFRYHRKTPHVHPRRNANKYGNKHHDHKGKSNKPHVPKEKFDRNCNFFGIYGHKENHCYKKRGRKIEKAKIM